MTRKLALKRIRSSDLSFFSTYLQKVPKTKQKGFNLDSALITGKFFPSLREYVEPLPKRAAHLDLTIFGPGMVEPESLARKIKRDAKNWRLNGEFVANPTTQPTRYDILAPADFAVFEFIGDIAPTAVKTVLVAKNHPDDMSLYAALDAFFPSGSRRELSEADIATIVANGSPPAGHPIRDWMDGELLEEIGQGDAAAIERLNTHRRGRGLSAAELKKAKANAEAVGRMGEELLDAHLTETLHPEIASYEWVSDANAISPFDFQLNHVDGLPRLVDAKSTGGPFTNPIYLSLAEIHCAVAGPAKYNLCRLYEVRETGATYRVALNIADKLRPVVAALAGLPPGVKVDSLSFNPDFFDFKAQETRIEYVDDEEDDGA